MWEKFLEVLKNHHVDPIKDILVPSISIDKFIALIGLIYVAITFHKNYQLAKFNFIFQLTQSHRDLWKSILETDLINKINDSSFDLATLTEKEKRQVINFFLHIKISYEAEHYNLIKTDKTAVKDIGAFMNYPVPNYVWNESKTSYEEKFQKFIAKAKYVADPINNPKPKSLLSNFIRYWKAIIHFLIRGIIQLYRRLLNLINYHG